MATTTKTRKVNSKKSSFDLYQHITDKMIEALEKGHIPWTKPWTGGKNDNHVLNFNTPRNYITNKPYNGLNILLLLSSGKKSRYWLTFKQATERNGKIKKGSKSEIVTYWFFMEKEKKQNGNVIKDENGKPIMVKIPVLKYYRVFSLDDIENLSPIKDRTDEPTIEAIQEIEKEKDFTNITAIDDLISNHENLPEIKHNDNRAYYSPISDYVNMPKPYKFTTNHHYYCTLFHELSHSTMHDSRLDRKEAKGNFFGTHDYSFEELIAELSACFLCAETGILNDSLLTNAQGYIKNWIKVLKDDKMFIVKASTQAQKATNYILSKK